MFDIAMIKVILDVANGAVNFSKFFSKKEQKEALAEWMIGVGKIVDEMADKLSNLEYPGGACGRLEVYINKFGSIADMVLPVEDLNNILDLLNYVRNIEKVYYEFSNAPQQIQANHISMLREASGKLIAHGEMLRLGR